MLYYYTCALAASSFACSSCARPSRSLPRSFCRWYLHTSAYVSIRQHTSACTCMRQQNFLALVLCAQMQLRFCLALVAVTQLLCAQRQLRLRMRPHTSAYVGIRELSLR